MGGISGKHKMLCSRYRLRRPGHKMSWNYSRVIPLVSTIVSNNSGSCPKVLVRGSLVRGVPMKLEWRVSCCGGDAR